LRQKDGEDSKDEIEAKDGEVGEVGGEKMVMMKWRQDGDDGEVGGKRW
jgi:hypothetical protein